MKLTVTRRNRFGLSWTNQPKRDKAEIEQPPQDAQETNLSYRKFRGRLRELHRNHGTAWYRKQVFVCHDGEYRAVLPDVDGFQPLYGLDNPARKSITIEIR